MDWLISLIMLVALEAVLGIDNLLYIAIESGRVDSSQQSQVQRIGIFGAVVMRVALLLLLVQLIQWFQLPFATVHWEGVIEASFNGHSVIAMVGGGFILYTAVKEVWHMLAGDLGSHNSQVTPKSVRAAILAMVLTHGLSRTSAQSRGITILLALVQGVLIGHAIRRVAENWSLY